MRPALRRPFCFWSGTLPVLPGVRIKSPGIGDWTAMLSAEQNDLITRTGPGTPAGG